MPANLNALIRYKQIDRELRNPYLKTTIKSLQNACSEQLAEHRGIYKLISERTIRDDIRVLRSEALGFNAPIIVENGVYSYSDTTYSIFNASIEEESLLVEILRLLLDEKSNIKSENIDDVILGLKTVLLNKFPAKKLPIDKVSINKSEHSFESLENSELISKKDLPIQDRKSLLSPSKLMSFKLLKFGKNIKIKKDTYTWSNILELI